MKDIQVHLKIVKSTHGSLEKACSHCGACCYAKAEVNGVPGLLKSLRCKHLRFDALGKSSCRVYADRLRKAPWCRNLTVSIEKGILPPACPYVLSLGGYQGPALLEDSQYRQVEDALREQQKGRPTPRWAGRKAWQAFLAGGAQ